ncbi:LacI family DNA-binding transcriptional regulator [Vibrio sp. Sgm 22]|uniref:LacI family DNA-binding transcriptional regulator n=1 Tax=unclassified Vibrio TaxID=2614977 RepID=UPI0022499ECE|nr:MULTISPECIES: LacI family DNA-binding transcriptional regulator [unclassified Vibrio]MCX2760006.1 LacI family DNA-binding transcriptional regulator [Vibrio sp. 14G-20]MCX2776994.1 LacI family DNA-binding transcriptional regulator [Vibrio sp. Sgm 22]
MDKNTITIKEVAEYANVSQATVSRVINQQSTVKERNLIKVLNAIEELGYTPNSTAKALATKKSNSIGMLVGSLDGPFYGPLMHATENEIYKLGLHLIVTSGQDSLEKETESLTFLRSKQVDGAIVHADQMCDSTLIDHVTSFKNFVVLNRHLPDLEQHCLYVDNELGGYLATQHLIDNGHRRIACITGPLVKHEARDRLLGYMKALAESNIDYDPSLIVEGRFDHKDNLVKANHLIQTMNDITGVFCQNDNIALAVYDACSQHNLQVGEDLSIVSFDNDLMSKHLRPLLTTVGFSIHDMGRLAGQMLIDQLSNKEILKGKKLTPSLEIRDSVKDLNQHH